MGVTEELEKILFQKQVCTLEKTNRFLHGIDWFQVFSHGSQHAISFLIENLWEIAGVLLLTTANP